MVCLLGSICTAYNISLSPATPYGWFNISSVPRWEHNYLMRLFLLPIWDLNQLRTDGVVRRIRVKDKVVLLVWECKHRRIGKSLFQGIEGHTCSSFHLNLCIPTALYRHSAIFQKPFMKLRWNIFLRILSIFRRKCISLFSVFTVLPKPHLWYPLNCLDGLQMFSPVSIPRPGTLVTYLNAVYV